MIRNCLLSLFNSINFFGFTRIENSKQGVCEACCTFNFSNLQEGDFPSECSGLLQK